MNARTSSRGAAGGTWCTPSFPGRSPPGTAWPRVPTGLDRPEPGQHRRPRVLRIKDSRTRGAPLLLRVDRQQGRQFRPGTWQWAGTMAVLEARQNPDGNLGFGFADELMDSFWEDVPVSLATACPHGWTYRTGIPLSYPTKNCPASSMSRQCWTSPPTRQNAGCCCAPARTGTSPTFCDWNRNAAGSSSTAGPGPSRGTPSGTCPGTFRSTSNWSVPVTSLRARTPWKSSSTATCASPSSTGRWRSAPGSTTSPRDGSAFSPAKDPSPSPLRYATHRQLNIPHPHH